MEVARIKLGLVMGLVMMEIINKSATLMAGIVVDSMLIQHTAHNVNGQGCQKI